MTRALLALAAALGVWAMATSADAQRAQSADAQRAQSADAQRAQSADAQRAQSADAQRAQSADAQRAQSADAQRGQSAAAQLGDPAQPPGRAHVHFGGSPRGGTFELVREAAEPIDGCALPCDLSLDEGEWHVRFASGVSSRVTLHEGDSLVLEARPDDPVMRWLGVAAGVAGLAAIVTTFAIDEGECFAGTRCENEWAIPVLAVGGLALVVGVYLAIDASGRVSVTALPPSRP